MWHVARINTYVLLEYSSGGQPIYKGMPPLTSYFVMRKEPWEKMTRGLLGNAAEEDEQRIMIISGMGGCGKTQLVIRFMKEFKKRLVGISSSRSCLTGLQIQIRILRRR
jgi:hypothetical protein